MPPDVEVELDPKAVRDGHDPQLEKAVEVVMDLLAKNPPPKPKRPPYRITTRRRDLGGATGRDKFHVTDRMEEDFVAGIETYPDPVTLYPDPTLNEVYTCQSH